MKIIVLAAGFATRMYPLTRDRAKPLLEVGGRPVLSRLMDRLLGVEEVDEVLVVTNARFRSQFDGWCASYAPPVPRPAAVPLRVIDDGARRDEDRLGAIGDLALALEALEDRRADLLVAAGDNLVDFDLGPHARRFAGLGRPLVLVREIEGPVPPRRYNEVILAGDDVASLREKPADPRSNLAALCLYFFPAAVHGWLAEYLQQGGERDAPGYFLEWLHARVPLAASRIDGGWYDIGNLETLERARTAFAPEGA